MSKEKLRMMLFPLIAIGVVILDLVSKYFVKQKLPLGKPVEIWGNFLRFTFVYNKGITFGMFNNPNTNSTVMLILLTVLALSALSLVVYFYLNITKFLKDGKPQTIGMVALMAIVGGALGNIIDRLFLFNLPGMNAVVDFVDVGIKNTRWYVFNVADSFVVVGAIVLGILFIFFEKKEKKAKEKESLSETTE